MRRSPAADRRLAPRDLAKFVAVVALMAIFADAALGHGLTWENDPYWTYWVTKTFLIATVFGLGTAWLGIGVGRGAIITAVHTVVLTVYYWTLSPVGPPSSPDWLDLEHTWVSGVPVHVAVIYLGYLMALWLWQRRAVTGEQTAAPTAAEGLRALVLALVIVVVAGGGASLALGEWPGLTWFVVRLLLTVPFLLAWWGIAGRDRTAAIVGGVTLALVWATYSQYLGPVGLPTPPIRIFTASAPPAHVHWLDYRELWLISTPIYLVVMVAAMLGDAALRRTGRVLRVGVTAALLITAILFTTGATLRPESHGESAALTVTGPAMYETGAFYGNTFEDATGDIRIDATDQGWRVTPLPPHDVLRVTATITAGGHSIHLGNTHATVEDPLGDYTTWWGVGFDVWHHGDSGIGTSLIPATHSDLAGFAIGDVAVDGATVGTGVPVHVMTMDDGKLELDVGDPRLGNVPGLPNGHVRAVWNAYGGTVPASGKAARYLVGGLVLIVLLVAMFTLARRPARREAA